MKILVHVNQQKRRGVTEIAVRYEGVVYGCLVTDTPLVHNVGIGPRVLDVCELWGNFGYCLETFTSMSEALDWILGCLVVKVPVPTHTFISTWNAREMMKVFSQSPALMNYLLIDSIIESNPKGVSFRSAIISTGESVLSHLSELCLSGVPTSDALINSYLPEFLHQECKITVKNEGTTLGEYSATNLYVGIGFTHVAEGLHTSMFYD